jgi:hypothetical protein
MFAGRFLKMFLKTFAKIFAKKCAKTFARKFAKAFAKLRWEPPALAGGAGLQSSGKAPNLKRALEFAEKAMPFRGSELQLRHNACPFNWGFSP